MSGPLVLVADDDEGVRTMLETMLGLAGFEVASARDGLECLLKLQMLEPAALVLDIMMPDVGGLRVLDELAREHSGVPVLVVTGRPDAAAECRERLGGDNVFEKPFSTERLVARLRAVAAGEA